MFSGPPTGLWTSPNPWLTAPAGSLAAADNVIFTAKGVIEPRRGFDEGATFGSSGSLGDALAFYGTQALLAYDFTRVAYLDDGDAAFTDFLNTFEPNGNNRMRFEPAARSMFFNPNDGIKVWDGVGNPSLASAAIEVGITFAFDGGSGTLASPFLVTNTTTGGHATAVAGVTGATGDLYAKTSTVVGTFTNNNALTGSGGWAADVNGNSLPAYIGTSALAGWAAGQVVTGRTSGATGTIVLNVSLGSSRALTLSGVTGTFVNETIDLSNGVLGQPYAAGCPQPLDIVAVNNGDDGWQPIDTAVAYRSTICRKDAFGRVVEGPPSGRTVVRNGPLSVQPGFLIHAGGGSQIVTATAVGGAQSPHNLNPGDVVTLGPGEANFAAGPYTVLTVPTEFTFTYDDGVPQAVSVFNTLEQFFSIARSNDLTCYFPDDVDTNNFLRVYRSETTDLASIAPSDELYQCYESPFLSAVDIAAGFYSFTDVTPESVLEVPLYTNSNSGDGTLAANYRPALAEDIVYWSNRMWYLNSTSLEAATLTLIGIGSPDGLQDGDTVVFIPTGGTIIDAAVFTARTTVTVPLTEFQIFSDADPAYNIERTAAALCRVVNDYQHFTDGSVYAYNISSEAGSPGKILFQARDFVVDADGHGPGFSVYSSRATAWTPQLPDPTTPAFAPLASDNNRHAARLWYSKLGQPEAVPLLNYEQVDADNSPGLRVFPLNYRLLVFKTDGVYFVPNTFPPTLQKLSDEVLIAPDSVQRLGDSVYFLSDRGLMVVDDSGVREVGKPIDLTLSGLNEPSALATVAERSFGLAYRSEDLYSLFLPLRIDDAVTDDTAIGYAHCRKGDGFTRAFMFGIRCGTIGPDGNMVVAPIGDNRLWLERKSLTLADYYDIGDVAYTCRVTFNPFTGGEPAVTKMAQQASFLFRENSVPILSTEFASEMHPAAVTVDLDNGGWGDPPWGQTPWGDNAPPLRRVQPLPVEVADSCQLSVGFSANCEGSKFVFLGIDIDANVDTKQSRDA